MKGTISCCVFFFLTNLSSKHMGMNVSKITASGRLQTNPTAQVIPFLLSQLLAAQLEEK